MIALHIDDINKMTTTLFKSTSFDQFALQEGSVSGKFSMFIEGNISPDYTSSEDALENEAEKNSGYVKWLEVRPLLVSLFENDTLPASFKIVLQAPKSYMDKLLNDPAFGGDPMVYKALILTFRYEHGKLTCLTGISANQFTLDKSIDKLWDQAICKSLDHLQIAFTSL